MPEGDTIHRTAHVLDRVLSGRPIVAARSNAGPRLPRPPALDGLVGQTVTAVEARGKHLLIRFSGGPTLHTHMGLHGSWHRYAPGERWLRSRSAAAVILETPDAVAVCFRPARVDLLGAGGASRSAALRELGPDLLADDFSMAAAAARLRQRDSSPIADALLDQRAVAGIGNVYKSELLFLAGVHPWSAVRDVHDAALERLLTDARRLMAANIGGGARRTTGADPAAAGAPLWVYGRTGRPCRRCGSRVRSARQGPLARMTYWCPTCQPAETA